MAYYFVIKELQRLWLGTAVAQWLRCCATNRKVAGSIPGVIGIFHWHKILPIALWSWGWLSLQQKWVPGIFPGGKDGRCVRLTTLPLSCAVVMKSGNLNFLEPSGPLQACHGTALPFHFLWLYHRNCPPDILKMFPPYWGKILAAANLKKNAKREHLWPNCR